MPTMERIGDTVPATTSIERLAAGLAILAAHDPIAVVTVDHEAGVLGSVVVYTHDEIPDEKRPRLYAAGWTNEGGAWRVRL